MTTDAAKREDAPRRLRRRDALHQHVMRFGPNMTPMVDIVLVILIFYMAATSFAGDEWLMKSLLQRRQADAQTSEPADPFELPPVRIDVALAVDASGRTVVSGLGRERADVESFIAAMKEFVEGTAKDRIIVLIQSEDAVPYEYVVRVHEACEQLKIGRVGIGLD